MSAENFDPKKLKGISIRTVFEAQTGNVPRFSSRVQEKLSTLDLAYVSPEGEQTLLCDMATAVVEGTSLRSIARKYGLTHKIVGELFQAKSIPYATREQAIQRLWNDPQFREKNGAAQAEVRGKYWQDPQKRESAGTKLRESMLKQWEDPEFRTLVAAASRKSTKKRWQDPEYRAKMAKYGIAFGVLNSDPEFLARLSETRRKQWEDPEFYARNVDISRRNLAETKKLPSYRKKRAELQKAHWEDPEYRARMAESSSRNLTQLWQDPEFRAAALERARETMTLLNNDPEFRAKGAKKRRELMLDPEYRDRFSETRRQISLVMWEDPEFRTKMSEIHKALWQDPEYRERISDAIRNAQAEPGYREKLVLPTIHGFRSDIGFYAQSAWEANIARVFQFIGRDYAIGTSLKLDITDEFKFLFQNPETVFNIDFSTIDKRGRIVMFELMAHPLEDPASWAKLEMARAQHPELVIRAIDETFYGRLRSRFEDPINNNSQLHGWEKTGFNLKTHPQIFA